MARTQASLEVYVATVTVAVKLVSISSMIMTVFTLDLLVRGCLLLCTMLRLLCYHQLIGSVLLPSCQMFLLVPVYV